MLDTPHAAQWPDPLSPPAGLVASHRVCGAATPSSIAAAHHTCHTIRVGRRCAMWSSYSRSDKRHLHEDDSRPTETLVDRTSFPPDEITPFYAIGNGWLLTTTPGYPTQLWRVTHIPPDSRVPEPRPIWDSRLDSCSVLSQGLGNPEKSVWRDLRCAGIAPPPLSASVQASNNSVAFGSIRLAARRPTDLPRYRRCFECWSVMPAGFVSCPFCDSELHFLAPPPSATAALPASSLQPVALTSEQATRVEASLRRKIAAQIGTPQSDFPVHTANWHNMNRLKGWYDRWETRDLDVKESLARKGAGP